MQKVYKIRRKSDGLFSSGGMYPSFSKKGKVWINLQALRSHITLCRKTNVMDKRISAIRFEKCGVRDQIREFPYLDCEVVEYIAQENIVEEIKENI